MIPSLPIDAPAASRLRSAHLAKDLTAQRATIGKDCRKQAKRRCCQLCVANSSVGPASSTVGDEERLQRSEDKADAQVKEFHVQIVHSISEVDAHDWNEAATGSGVLNPFVLHGFLKALEDSHSSVKQTGWYPYHIVVRAAGSNDILGCCPMYLKGHSYGEYVFDHSWAALAARFGQRYYPKLQSCVPFSPVGGPRILVKPQADRASTVAAIAKAIIQITDDLGVSSSHVTFNEEHEWQSLRGLGFLQRTGIQYHWDNPGYATFEDFLAELKQPKRKNIRQERKAVAASGLKVRRFSGDDLRPSHWDAFYEFYRNTTDSKWGSAYLTREFFHELGLTLGPRVLLVTAQEGDAASPLVAGALNLVGSGAVFGRNWGCARSCHVKHLHFEMCYYQRPLCIISSVLKPAFRLPRFDRPSEAQEEAISRGLRRVEAGAQGEHKLQRGYLPSKTFSSHYVRDPSFRRVLEQHLEGERASVDYNLQVLTEIASPYKGR